MTEQGDTVGNLNGKFRKRANGSWHPIVSAVIGAVLGSGGSLGIIFSTPIGQELARPDPYTSVQAEAEHKQLARRIEVCERHMENHPDAELRAALGVVIADVAAGKAERSLIIQNQNRILDRLDGIK